MIKGKDIYEVVAALVPLYVAVVLAYGSVKWWKIFTPDQCSGINRYVAVFAIPFISFKFISFNNIYEMNFRFLGADALQKVAILVLIFLWQTISKKGDIGWSVTLFSLSSLPNTLVIGVPLLTAMYGDFTSSLMIQIQVFQSFVWFTLLLFMFEYRAAKLLITENFPETAKAISSFRVDPDVCSLSGIEPLETEAEIQGDGKLHVVVRRSSSFSSSINGSSFNKARGRALDLNSVEIFSVPSSRESALRLSSSFNEASISTRKINLQSSTSMAENSRSFHLDCEIVPKIGKKSGAVSSYPICTDQGSLSSGESGRATYNNCKQLHVFAWNSNQFLSSINQNGYLQRHGPVDSVAPSIGTGKIESPVLTSQHDASSPREKEGPGTKEHEMASLSVVTRLIFLMVWRKLIRNPNTYASVLGLVWSLISFRWNINLPSIVAGSIKIMSDTSIGMAMFSLGASMALQPKPIACGKLRAILAMVARFCVGPAVMAACSLVIGIRGDLLRTAIVQAALPLSIVPFVFAKEYDVHVDIISTGATFGMIVALPVTIIYYILLGL